MKKPKKAYNLSSAEFYDLLFEVLCRKTPAQIIAIPGVYDVLAEDLNNEVLELWESREEES